MSDIKISRAAIKYHKINDPDNYKIEYGFNHDAVMNSIRAKKDSSDIYEYQYGFITNERPLHFVSRREAAEIAFEAGQISKPKKLLYSDDLFDPKGRLIKK